MMVLNWNMAELSQTVFPSGERLQMTLEIGAPLLKELTAVLSEIFINDSGDARELRHVLPQEWCIFWKLRPGESRMLVAHPESGQYVATVALEWGHAQTLIRALSALREGQDIHVSNLSASGTGQEDWNSNLDLVIRHS